MTKQSHGSQAQEPTINSKVPWGGPPGHPQKLTIAIIEVNTYVSCKMRKKLSERYDGDPNDFDNQLGSQDQKWALYVLFSIIGAAVIIGVAAYLSTKNKQQIISTSTSNEIRIKSANIQYYDRTGYHTAKYEEIGRNGINVLVYTPHTDSISLWEISQMYRRRDETMVSFFDAKIDGSVDDYLLSDHWWAYYLIGKNGTEELTFTNHGRRHWGTPLSTTPKVHIVKQRPSRPNLYSLEYEEIGRNGINVLIYTPHTDSISLWQISQLYQKPGITMVSFFDAKIIDGSVDDYLLSDHWWAVYFSGSGELTFTNHGRRHWGTRR